MDTIIPEKEVTIKLRISEANTLVLLLISELKQIQAINGLEDAARSRWICFY